MLELIEAPTGNLVSDTDWMNNSVKALGFLMPCPVRVFPLDEMGAAKEWIGG